jgi:hypothetical protein
MKVLQITRPATTKMTPRTMMWKNYAYNIKLARQQVHCMPMYLCTRPSSSAARSHSLACFTACANCTDRLPPFSASEHPPLSRSSTTMERTVTDPHAQFIFPCVHLFSLFPFPFLFLCIRLLLRTVHCGLCIPYLYSYCGLWTVPTVALCIKDL